VKLFISWSGSRSHQIARILRESLPNVLPHVEPWFSSEDIAKGTRWSIELGKELDAAKFGIICLVPENLHEDWVIFEAGAMSRSIDTARVAPLLVDVAVKDVPGPLAQFQCTGFEQEDVRRLVRSVNQTTATPMDQANLDEAFDRHWPRLASLVESVRSSSGGTAPPREVPRIVDRTVSLSYPDKAGITEKLRAEGYDLGWIPANAESEKVDLEGWEYVLLDQSDGTKARLKIPDHPVIGGYVVLLKKKRK
jgi:TIR domain-containing protein